MNMIPLYLDDDHLSDGAGAELNVQEEYDALYGDLLRIEVSYGNSSAFVMLDDLGVELLLAALLEFLSRAK